MVKAISYIVNKEDGTHTHHRLDIKWNRKWGTDLTENMVRLLLQKRIPDENPEATPDNVTIIGVFNIKAF